jgi:hypothetical protein
MKTFLKPGFEFIFSLSLIVILGLPPVLMAQNTKNTEITILNGDTTVNGKNIKELSEKDRHEALKDISRMSSQTSSNNGDNTYSFKRKDSVSKFRDVAPKMAFKYRMNEDQMHSNMDFKDRGNEDGFRNRMARFDRRNSQNFDYINTDKDGISTHVRFHVSEISNDDLKRMPHVEGGKFEISDLNLVPEFSTGKTLLMFNLPAKTAAEVKLTDGEGKVLWNEKSAGGNFSKAFVMGLNGVYYLQVKQGHNIAIRRIMKAE